MIICSQLLAAEAGLEILRTAKDLQSGFSLGKGVDAAEAAVAASTALNRTEPSACGLGGDGFCLFYDAGTKEVEGLNGSVLPWHCNVWEVGFYEERIIEEVVKFLKTKCIMELEA